MIYSIYSTQTGEILRVVDCTQDILYLQFDSGTQNALEGRFSDSTYYVEGGVPVIKPLPPSQYHIFDYITKQWIDPRTPATQWPIARNQRDQLLQASDWTQLPDVPLSTKEAWAAYRQALRDVTLQPDPFNITWPQPPQ